MIHRTITTGNCINSRPKQLPCRMSCVSRKHTCARTHTHMSRFASLPLTGCKSRLPDFPIASQVYGASLCCAHFQVFLTNFKKGEQSWEPGTKEQFRGPPAFRTGCTTAVAGSWAIYMPTITRPAKASLPPSLGQTVRSPTLPALIHLPT